MTVITKEELGRITRASLANENFTSVHLGLVKFGDQMGLGRMHRLVPYLSQLKHESGAFRHDREIWGPTPAQSRYEGRKDLGNVVAGDGSRYRGRGPIQITGRSNYEQFTAWCRRFVSANAPDFVANPELVNTDPWEGLVAIWYWSTRNLNTEADRGDIDQISRRINGGNNGLQDRRDRYVRLALNVLGIANVRALQSANGLKVDGDAGPLTRAKIHQLLSALPERSFSTPSVISAGGLTAFLRRIFSFLLPSKGTF